MQEFVSQKLQCYLTVLTLLAGLKPTETERQAQPFTRYIFGLFDFFPNKPLRSYL